MLVKREIAYSNIICAMHYALQSRAGNGNGTRDPRLLEGVLSNVALFRGVGQRALADLAGRARALHFRRGALICPRGECQSGPYALAYGQVKLALRGAEGDERVLRVLGPADSFDLSVILLGRPLPYEAVALEDVLIVTVPASAVFALIENDPRFMRTVIQTLAEHNVSLLGEVESGALQRGVQRLAAYLNALAVPNGSDGAFVAQLPTTKTIVASRLGVKKETLSRMLRDLARRGVIAVDQRAISILDRNSLSALARERT